ncbi:hypothetical protein KI912_003131 [Salmonella enterica]|nr:hypothetical protein [Salmonella enterica]
MEKKLKNDWEGMLFDIRRCVRYHNRRRSFFDRIDKLSNLLSLILGSATIYGILAQTSNSLALCSAAVVTIFSSLNLVLASSQQARVHYDLARRFGDLEMTMIQMVPSEKKLTTLQKARLSIEKDEPPALRVLDCICYNEQLRAMDFSDNKMLRIGLLQRLFSPFIDFRPDRIIRVSDQDNHN